jgi:Family of unknown function (DUF6535)
MSLSSCAPRFIFHTASHIKSILQMSLFSAVVAALLSVTVLDIKQDSQDTSASYLENTYKLQVLANSNGSHPFTPAQPSQFSAPKYAIWVNTLLLMSLCLNIFAALLALSIRGYVPDYLLLAGSPQFSPYYRARMREIFAGEWEDSLVPSALVTILWISPFPFFVSLSIYLFHYNRAVFGAVFSCICVCFIILFLGDHSMDKVSAFYRVPWSSLIRRLFTDSVQAGFVSGYRRPCL